MRLAKLSHLPLLTILVGFFSVQAFGIEAVTNPVGVIQITALGNSDTLISMPLKQPAVFNGVIGGLTTDTLTVQGSPGWDPDEWAGAYYGFVRSGDVEGAYASIVSNTADTLKLDVGLDGTLLVDGPAVNDSVSIHRFWTLDSLFPDGAGVHASPSAGSRSSEIFIPAVAEGINNAADATYYYLGVKWRKVGALLDAEFGDTILYPDSYFILRNDVAGNTTVTFTGEVVMGGLSLPVVIGDTLQQDNPIGLQRPIEMTLIESGLSDSFEAGDELLIWDNSAAKQNRLAGDATVYTWDGAKWIKDGVNVDVGNDAVFTPGLGFIVRKKAGGGLAEIDWSNLPNYGN
ncbi:MAG: TIGR02597 family protein [Verrucomicrobia bacterium]|nr:TIGR02597 family protein [Verrucomicrobiota bacterium]MDA1067939.1 TIGR02597 family protein [Verrucomicrobiota bacterium]